MASSKGVRLRASLRRTPENEWSCVWICATFFLRSQGLASGACSSIWLSRSGGRSAGGNLYNCHAERGGRQLPAADNPYSSPHLPQGAPTSPALANICSYRLDCRLSGLANAADAAYTRYADDIAFSGDERFERHVDRFSTHVAAICMEEGFSVHHRKTRVMRRGVRQHLAGLTINSHSNVMRADFDRLKAILTNSLRHGPESQNREQHPAFRQHLEGRVAFVAAINPGKGARFREIFEQIEWH